MPGRKTAPRRLAGRPGPRSICPNEQAKVSHFPPHTARHRKLMSAPATPVLCSPTAKNQGTWNPSLSPSSNWPKFPLGYRLLRQRPFRHPFSLPGNGPNHYYQRRWLKSMALTPIQKVTPGAIPTPARSRETGRPAPAGGHGPAWAIGARLRVVSKREPALQDAERGRCRDDSPINRLVAAEVAELVDAVALEAIVFNDLGVRAPSSAPVFTLQGASPRGDGPVARAHAPRFRSAGAEERAGPPDATHSIRLAKD